MKFKISETDIKYIMCNKLNVDNKKLTKIL